MKKKQLNELKGKNLNELEKMIKEKVKQLVNLKMQLKTGKLKNFNTYQQERHSLARIKTLISEKKLKSSQAGDKTA